MSDDAPSSTPEPLSRVPEAALAALETPTVPPDAAVATASLPPRRGLPRSFGDYLLLKEIARGGMGVVYKARQISLNRIVALKLILAGHLASKEVVLRFYAEAEAAANLDHPGIVPVFEVGEVEDCHYFSMGFVDGVSLAEQIQRGPAPPRRAAELLATIAEAVHFAHEHAVIHRDLKPANILLDAAGRPRITDFGIAKQVHDDTHDTHRGEVLGTPSYMPPEQAAGQSEQLGPWSDVYSLGAILYALLTGRPPFQAASQLDTLMQVLEREPVPPRQLNALVPRDLNTIAMKCLQKMPRRRYASAWELVLDLRRYLAGEPIRARPSNGWALAWRWCRRNLLVASVSGTAALLLMAAAAVAVFAYHRESAKRADLEDKYVNSAEVLLSTQRLARQEATRCRALENQLRALQDQLERVGTADTGVPSETPTPSSSGTRPEDFNVGEAP
jgi:serine/threonine-protein kinase